MRRLWNPTVALVTFLLGLACTSLWLSGGRIFLKAEVPSFSSAPLFSQNQSDPEAEKYAVYSALIKDMYVDGRTKLLVIEGAGDCPSPSPADKVSDKDLKKMRDEMEGYAFKQFPELKLETIDDFHARTKECVSLNSRFEIPIEYVIVSYKEINSLFSKQGLDGWDRFYERYPVSSGIIGFSNVGFNRAMNQALVSTSRSCGGLCGAGYFVLLKKEQGVWKVQSKQMTWVS
ncbi:MAG TPA: hypothetical protein VEV81_11360 [Pyrinomonadaceae bacterium]|nr:hypothetical protein [Pyrinomonadaceae bacterium]